MFPDRLSEFDYVSTGSAFTAKNRLEMAICSYEMNSQVDDLYQKKLKQNKKKPNYDDCYYQISKKLCKDFHISSHENSGACRRGSPLVEKWCVNDHLKYDQKASA